MNPLREPKWWAVGRRGGLVPPYFELAVTLFVSLYAATALGQLPAARLEGVFPAGAAAGATAEVTIFGADLDDVDRLHFSHPGLTVERAMAEPGPFDEGPQPIENRFRISAAADVPPGIYEVRCQGKYGLSNARPFVVSTLAELIESEPNNEFEQANSVALPVIINGRANERSDVDWYQLDGKAGQRVLCDCLARGLDSRMDAVLTVFDARGVVLAEGRYGQAFESLIDLTLPADGVYWLKVHDLLYGGGGDYAYRITVGSLPYLESIYPPAGLAGSNDEYTVFGRNLPGGVPADFVLGGRQLEKLAVRIPIPADAADKLVYRSRLDPHQAGLDGIEFRLGAPPLQSNPLLVSVAGATVIAESPDNDAPRSAQQLTIPCEVAGRFYPERDRDWFTFEAKAGDIYAVEVFSHRLGLPTDAAMHVEQVTTDDKGNQQATRLAWVDDAGARDGGARDGGHEFDQRTSDPSYRFTAPADGTYRILIQDAYASLAADPRLVYRLVIRPPQPDFRLAAVPAGSSGALLLRKGGREVIHIVAFRQDGYDGEITVAASGLPPGLTATEAVIGPGLNSAAIVLSADDNAPAGIASIQVTGKGMLGTQEVTRIARPGCAIQAAVFNQPDPGTVSVPGRIADRIMLAVSESEPAPISLTLSDGRVFETARGGVLKVPYTVRRLEGAGGSITGFPIDVPPGTNVSQIGIGDSNSGEFELRIAGTVPPGAYSMYVAGFVQNVQYRRNPEAAARAKERQERLAKLLEEATAKANETAQGAQAAQNALVDSDNTLATAAAELKTAEEAAQSARDALAAATDALARAKDALAANPGDAGLQQQVAASQQQADDAARLVTTSGETATSAAKKVEEATSARKLAQETKAAADEVARKAAEFATQAQQVKQAADARAAQLQNEANPRGFNVTVPSTSVTIKIAEYPITAEGPPATAALKQGEKVAVPVKIARLYDFAGDVAVQLLPIESAVPVQAPAVSIPNGQTDGMLTIEAPANATPGEFRATARLTMNFNGFQLTWDRPFTLTIQAVEPPKP